jgi:hypothetical protein
MVNVPETYGTVLLGGFIATMCVALLFDIDWLTIADRLSGIITAQAFHYFRRYPSDTIRMKAIVRTVPVLSSVC